MNTLSFASLRMPHSAGGLASPAACGRASTGSDPVDNVKNLLIRVFDALGTWHDRAAARRQLMTLDDRMLADIGRDRAQAYAEADKPFWMP